MCADYLSTRSYFPVSSGASDARPASEYRNSITHLSSHLPLRTDPSPRNGARRRADGSLRSRSAIEILEGVPAFVAGRSSLRLFVCLFVRPVLCILWLSVFVFTICFSSLCFRAFASRRRRRRPPTSLRALSPTDVWLEASFNVMASIIFGAFVRHFRSPACPTFPSKFIRFLHRFLMEQYLLLHCLPKTCHY